MSPLGRIALSARSILRSIFKSSPSIDKDASVIPSLHQLYVTNMIYKEKNDNFMHFSVRFYVNVAGFRRRSGLSGDNNTVHKLFFYSVGLFLFSSLWPEGVGIYLSFLAFFTFSILFFS